MPLKKLVDCHPRWLTPAYDHYSETIKVGVAFHCPIHPVTAESGFFGHFISVFFTNPIGGGPPDDGLTWARTGETFETLTLKPSIRRSGVHCNWHGYITNGEMITLADSR